MPRLQPDVSDPLAAAFAGISSQPAAGPLLDIPRGYVRACDLREGDLLLCLSCNPVALTIATIGLSFGSSHCGVVVKMPDNLLYVAEARPTWTYSVGNVSGVVASTLPAFVAGSAFITAYRPTPSMTREQLARMRAVFRARMGEPYSLNLFDAWNSFLGCSLCPTSDLGFFCSQLNALMYDAAGVLHPRSCCGLGDQRRDTYSYRPSDLPRMINGTRLGSVSAHISFGGPGCPQ